MARHPRPKSQLRTHAARVLHWTRGALARYVWRRHHSPFMAYAYCSALIGAWVIWSMTRVIF